MNRVTTVTYPGGSNSYSYDAVSRLTSVTDPTGATTYAFDGLSRATGITTPQGSVNYTYNDANQRTSMTLPGGRAISYNYDTTGRLANISDWVSGVINYSFDADGNLTGLSRSNGVNSSYGYDNAGRLTGISHNGPSGNLLFTNYTLDANGNRNAMASNAGAESYTLDVLNRLTNATYPNGDTAAYSYDANGNRLSQTFNGVTTNYTYDDAGQLLTDGATSYSYDANGNLISAGADTYTWDWANRMTAATVGGNNASYAYDAFDVRVSGAVNGVATNYLWDRLAQNPTLVDDGTHAYVHGVGPQAQIDSSGNRHYLLSDALSSIRGVTDGSGALVGGTAYDAFGAVRSQTGTGSVLGYTGELYTPATGLLHLRARDLNPTLGRFLSVDTVQPNAPGSQGFNGYAYVANNPTLWVDPSGHTATSGYFGTARFLPLFLGAAAFALAASLATQIELTLTEGRNPQSWSFGNHTATTNLVLTTFAMVLRCALIPGCMDAVGGIGNAAKQLGSDALGGVTDWTPGTLPNAWSDYPAAPPVVAPAPVTNPGPASPAPDPGSKGPPGWFWPVAGALAALAAWTAYQYFSPAPARDPLSGPDPANDPLSPPGATPTPTEDSSCSADIEHLVLRARYLQSLHEKQPAQDRRTTAILRLVTTTGECVDLVAGGAKHDIAPEQVAHLDQSGIFGPPEVPVFWGSELHAEKKLLFKSQQSGFWRGAVARYVAMGVSREICPVCQGFITGPPYRGTIKSVVVPEGDAVTWD